MKRSGRDIQSVPPQIKQRGTSDKNRLFSSDGKDLTNLRLKEDFTIVCSEDGQEVKLKVLKKNSLYVPREILTEGSVFTQVTVLDVSNCQIIELEGRIFIQLRNLVKLFAARNRIKYISGMIGECQRLQAINLDCN